MEGTVLSYLSDNIATVKCSNNVNTKDSTVSVILLQEELWDKFNSITTEMIVTKSGRRMFPVIKLDVQGLEHNSMYIVVLEFKQIGEHRWKFVNNEWVQGSKSECKALTSFSYYTHPESPNYGAHWMKKPIEFPKVKLTNKQPPEEGQVVLNSLHKYQPVVHIIKSNTNQPHQSMSFPLSRTQFVAVTAYQNEAITDLKIKNNPYAKAFAEKSKKIQNKPSSLSDSQCSYFPHSYNYNPNNGVYVDIHGQQHFHHSQSHYYGDPGSQVPTNGHQYFY